MAWASVSCSPISCPFPSLTTMPKSQPLNPARTSRLHPSRATGFLRRGDPPGLPSAPHGLLRRRARLLFRRSSATGEGPDGTTSEDEEPAAEVGGEGGYDWTTSALLFALWGALMYYAFQLAPNQTPSRDMYFLQKLLYLKADDGFRMNQVLVALWNIMGLWPLVYSMLLLPSGRSSRSKVPVWPFLVLSFFGGAYVLIPYFVLWKPPPPAFEEEEIGSWPLNFLESKITAGLQVWV